MMGWLRWAVLFAAFFNFAAYFLSVIFPSLHKVAETIGKGIIDKDVITPSVVFGPGDIAQAHTRDEWISIASLDRGTAILERFLRTLP